MDLETGDPAPRNVPYGLQNIAREAYYALLEKILEGLEMNLDRQGYPTVVITDYAKRRRLGGVTLSTGSVVVAKIMSDLPVGEPDELANEFCPGGIGAGTRDWKSCCSRKNTARNWKILSPWPKRFLAAKCI